MYEYLLDYEFYSAGVVLYGMYHPFHYFDGSTRKCRLSPEPISIFCGTLTLPSEIHGKPVVGIADFWMMGGNPYNLGMIDVKHLIVPESYERLGNKNFSGWENLEIVTLYCDANAMSEYNFAYCDKLVRVECMNPSIYSFCKSLPLKCNQSGFGCFEGRLEQIKFLNL